MRKRKSVVGILVIVLIGIILADSASAWPRIFRRRRRSNNYSSRTYNSRGSWPSNISGSAQAKAEYKARLIANRDIRNRSGHNVCPLVARFEGIGRGKSPNCGTCTPRGRMTLVADAVAYNPRTGLYYRVRGWN